MVLATLASLALIGAALLDAFETIVLPRRISRRLRVANLVYRLTWPPYGGIARHVKNGARRETVLSFYGPSSLVVLVGVWAAILIAGFAGLQWAAGSALSAPENQRDFATDLYFSGTTFFTLGLGDVVPDAGVARVLTVVEGGTGFGFLALLIGYLPIVYQMFARRETNVSLLDQRAGSPPSAVELIRRNVQDGDQTELIKLLKDWELWVADLLESHLSYPTLAYFRSQHENQSWVGALAVILDVSAYILACGTTRAVHQAGFTFAVGRHAVGDLTNVFDVPPHPPAVDRLDSPAVHILWETAASSGLLTGPDTVATARLTAIRSVYEPYLQALSEYLLMDLPPWVPAPGALDNWESTAWDFASPVSLLGSKSPFSKR
jgi:Ion channel